jgi:hypothetical protein
MLAATTSDYAGRLCSHLEMSGTLAFLLDLDRSVWSGA